MSNETRTDETLTRETGSLAVASRRLATATRLLGTTLARLDLGMADGHASRSPVGIEYESVLRAVMDVLTGRPVAADGVELEDTASTTLSGLLREAAQVLPDSSQALVSVIKRAADAVEDDERCRRHVEIRLQKLSQDVENVRRKSRFETERTFRLPGTNVVPAVSTGIHMEPVDCIVVAEDSLQGVKDLLTRITTLTVHPYNLILVDQASRGDVRAYLTDFTRTHPNVNLVMNGRRVSRCRATNLGLSLSTAPWIFCFAGGEPFPLRHGWETPVIEYMRQHGTVGLSAILAGKGHPVTGRDYSRMDWFRHFRNKWFALEQRDRVFAQVQNGFIVLRRSTFEEIGYFNEAIPEDEMYAEYSYCAESRGWALAEVPAARHEAANAVTAAATASAA